MKEVLFKPTRCDPDIEEKITPLTTTEARRVGNVYNALIDELYESGCIQSAQHMICLVAKENKLIAEKSIRDRLRNNLPLLLKLVENAKIGEQASVLKNSEGFTTALRILYQSISLLSISWKYEWLLQDAFEVVAAFCNQTLETKSGAVSEIVARLYFKYSNYLAQNSKDRIRAMNYMEKALIISRENTWLSDEVVGDTRAFPTIHMMAGRRYAMMLMQQAHLRRSNPQVAGTFAFRALVTLSEVGVKYNKLEYCQASYLRAMYLTQCGYIDKGLKMLKTLEENVKDEVDNEFKILRCDIFQELGNCYLLMNDLRSALHSLMEGLQLCRRYKCKASEGKTLIMLGRLYSKDRNYYYKAKQSYEEAKMIFEELNDIENCKKAYYLLSQMRAQEIFPDLMHILKNLHVYCNKYHLMQWKTLNIPFWNLPQHDPTNPNFKIHCLMTEKPSQKEITAKNSKKIESAD